jgi:hypothetical protein
VKIYPAHFFGEVLPLFLKYLIAGCSFLILIGSIRAGDVLPPGFLEGHLRIVALKGVELAEGNAPAVTAATYAEYPLIILSKAEQKEIGRVTADRDGNYRLSLPPGDYILDVHGRGRGRVRAKPQPFTVVSNQTVRADMDMDTGVR